MDQIEIYLEKNIFHIISQKDLQNLRIWNKKTHEETYFTLVSEGHYQISAEKVIALLDTTKNDRAYIIFGDHQEVNLAHSQLKQLRNDQVTQTTIGGIPLSLYVSLDDTLRFMCNLLPSARAYYLKNNVHTINVNNDTVSLNLDIYTRFFPLKALDFKVTHRQLEKSFTLTDFIPSSSDQVDNNTFINHIQISYQPAKQLQKIAPNINLNGYNWQFFDLRFQLHFATMEVRPRSFRVDYNANCAKDCVVPYTNNLLLYLDWYGTQKYNKLSHRIAFVPKDTYQTYLEFKKNDHKEKPVFHSRTVLISEYPQKAQDNGFVLFSYLMHKKSSEFDPYFVVTKDSPDLANLKKYMDHVVFYNTPEHVKIFMQTDILCHTHSSDYAMPFRNNYFIEKKKTIHKVFLQHGITAVRNIDHLYGKDAQPDFTNKFIVSSEREKQLVIDKLGYDAKDVAITGFARFDLLLKHNNRLTSFLKRKRVLLMPTWREELVNLSDDEFVKTDYFKELNSLITSKRLLTIKQSQHLTIDFYLHTNFQKFAHLFHSNEVNILHEGQQTVQNILKSHGILITDFSSVGLDFALLNRAVLYYQFDGLPANGALSDQSEKILPGPIITTEEELISELQVKVKNNRLDDKYAKNVSQNLYKFQDRHARDRIFELLRKL
ncbi:CDP-glycerol glycerophosphotransferase family protein [Pediococcus inopinatus]|uniref:CDP-glycerol glycerophosphotransferase family protein n=1 Tax=Pediococcus inopinatus TaxID=114090 RepID=UPI00070E9D9E|nr:CDP-glycerol glycerophosphotransferase family protein [Pediococcus inopinatus]AVL00911.1 hypothetical protein PI20285_09800 [Pediococcus inopinatus]KRN62396.1 hypothetical protein IV83_GL000274 [Pediococcus inopinatus]